MVLLKHRAGSDTPESLEAGSLGIPEAEGAQESQARIQGTDFQNLDLRLDVPVMSAEKIHVPPGSLLHALGQVVQRTLGHEQQHHDPGNDGRDGAENRRRDDVPVKPQQYAYRIPVTNPKWGMIPRVPDIAEQRRRELLGGLGDFSSVPVPLMWRSQISAEYMGAKTQKMPPAMPVISLPSTTTGSLEITQMMRIQPKVEIGALASIVPLRPSESTKKCNTARPRAVPNGNADAIKFVPELVVPVVGLQVLDDRSAHPMLHPNANDPVDAAGSITGSFNLDTDQPAASPTFTPRIVTRE